MRTFVTCLAASLLLALPLAAQEKSTISVFFSDIHDNMTAGQRPHWYGGFGASFDRMLGERVSAQLSVTSEEHRTYPYGIDANGAIVALPVETVTTYPIDLTARYHWLNDSRWKPFLGAGLHYIAAPNRDRRLGYRNHLTPMLTGGVEYQLRPSFGIFVEGKQLIGDRESYDAQFRFSAGVSWRF